MSGIFCFLFRSFSDELSKSDRSSLIFCNKHKTRTVRKERPVCCACCSTPEHFPSYYYCLKPCSSDSSSYLLNNVPHNACCGCGVSRMWCWTYCYDDDSQWMGSTSSSTYSRREVRDAPISHAWTCAEKHREYEPPRFVQYEYNKPSSHTQTARQQTTTETQRTCWWWSTFARIKSVDTQTAATFFFITCFVRCWTQKALTYSTAFPSQSILWDSKATSLGCLLGSAAHAQERSAHAQQVQELLWHIPRSPIVLPSFSSACSE